MNELMGMGFYLGRLMNERSWVLRAVAIQSHIRSVIYSLTGDYPEVRPTHFIQALQQSLGQAPPERKVQLAEQHAAAVESLRRSLEWLLRLDFSPRSDNDICTVDLVS
ncbi:hypothetical protein IPJ72_07340 [Candidatus Peregrinibacteria bacterium]|nr:MAG: hypothetical protein IPJ72_07340 [Candidatus Peregrinibacteria bacterium]